DAGEHVLSVGLIRRGHDYRAYIRCRNERERVSDNACTADLRHCLLSALGIAVADRHHVSARDLRCYGVHVIGPHHSSTDHANSHAHGLFLLAEITFPGAMLSLPRFAHYSWRTLSPNTAATRMQPITTCCRKGDIPSTFNPKRPLASIGKASASSASDMS